MKFEKFLKNCGTHGQILDCTNGDKWLVCGRVGMKVPVGVVNLLGVGEVGKKTREIIEQILTADTDNKVELMSAYIPADGKPNDIIRIFNNPYDCEVGISNADFGLLEKSDDNLAYYELDEIVGVPRLLLVLNQDEEIIGFIQGVPEN